MKTSFTLSRAPIIVTLAFLASSCSFSESDGSNKASFTLSEGQSGDFSAMATVTGCLTPGMPCADTKEYQIQGTGNIPNFHTAVPFYRSALSLSASESPTLKKIENRVWDNIPNYGHPGIIGDTNGIALIQVAAAACNDYLEKGRYNSGFIGGLNIGQPASSNSGNWQGYVNNLTTRLWAETNISGEEKDALDQLRTKSIQAYPSDTKKVAYLLCIAVASAPKGLIN